VVCMAVLGGSRELILAANERKVLKDNIQQPTLNIQYPR
jgi:hypothetical protein